MASNNPGLTASQYIQFMDRIRREKLDPFYNPTPEEWRKQMERYGYKVQGFPLAQSQQVIKDDPHAPTPLPSSTPQPKKPDTNHMWDMLVLAARSSRYGD